MRPSSCLPAVLIGRALITNPDLLILDETTISRNDNHAGLDCFAPLAMTRANASSLALQQASL
jgi:ABC-type molybdenum transport system ATPase subunit/photorepair protein PhrA